VVKTWQVVKVKVLEVNEKCKRTSLMTRLTCAAVRAGAFSNLMGADGLRRETGKT
jgi:ribosomal protein S1